MKGAREDTMAKFLKYFAFALLLVAVLPGCVMTRDSAANMAATAASEAAATTAATMMPPPTQTPRPTATRNMVATYVAATVAAREGEATVEAPASTVTISTMTPSPEGENPEDATPAAPAAGGMDLDVEWEEFANGLISIGGFPEQESPTRWSGIIQPNNPCEGPPDGCWLFAREGVLSYDEHTPETEANESAVWSGGPDVAVMVTNNHETVTIPDGGYLKFTTGQVVMEIPVAEIGLRLNPADGVGYLTVVRGFFAEENRGLAPVHLSVDEPGSLHVMRYPINPEFSGFYSAEHLSQDMHNILGDLRENADNCNADGCGILYVIGIDINKKTVSIWEALSPDAPNLLYSNVIRPTAAP